ncbi:macrophage migration inhibitory factor-like [Saccoglossus kowalevskii]|uniref:L-dopachrome isomerase n=1 Tax=Saccoglossus kowalevskii TaxID=10224 RepID=A0ABM0GIK6_SACKO|nr:PREDICTED: macrophage migration inhibitory factor-like [Saccoglossus kowalevskii]
MPVLTIFTNVSRDKIPSDSITTLTKLLVDLLQKDQKYISIHIRPDEMMGFNGTTDSCAHVTLVCIGKIGLEENKVYSKAIMEWLNTRLGIDATRMYISFISPERENIGYNYTTFAK